VSLAGKVIIVTGGSRGIGRACVLRAVDCGARVVFCSRGNGADSRQLEAAAAARGGPGAATGLATDVSDDASVRSLFAAARDRCGAVHGVVNNAAISRESLLVSSSSAEWDDVIDTNLTGSFLVARESIRLFLEQRQGGRLVAIGTLSQYGVAGNTSYATSKGGLLGLTRSIASRYTQLGIVSTMVIPGYVETEMSSTMSDSARRSLIDGCPLRRPGSPEEIAAVVTFLLSDAAAGLDGQAIFASGGLREVPV
jgi:3-oxoacyl-[acyl-carrier protein] reductase